MTFDEYWNDPDRARACVGLYTHQIARSAYEAGAREEAELKQAWKDKAISLRARIVELEGALDGIRQIRPMIHGTKSIDEPRLGWKDYQDAWKAVDAALAVPPEPEPKAPEPMPKPQARARGAQLRCGHCNEWCEPACPSCGHELLEHVPSTAAPVPPESVRAEDGKVLLEAADGSRLVQSPDGRIWAGAAPASEPKTSAAAGVGPAIGVLLTCGHVMGDGLCREHCRYPSEAAPYEPVMCSCGREFDTPQALWDHYVKDGASDEERESHGATTPAPREPCCDLASRGTHRKGCTGEPMSKQIADALGGEAPLRDAELVALRKLIAYFALHQLADRERTEAARAAVAARKEPKP